MKKATVKLGYIVIVVSIVFVCLSILGININKYSAGWIGELARMEIAKGEVDSVRITIKPLIINALPFVDRPEADAIFSQLEICSIFMTNEDIKELREIGRRYIMSRNSLDYWNNCDSARRTVLEYKDFVGKLNAAKKH